MSLPLYPIWVVDLAGSSLMIFFSFLCVRLARRLRAQDTNNVIWIYLLWFCYSLAAFAISRSVGHIVKRVLITAGYENVWELLQPYSGSINSITFIIVASITLFFERTWKVYQQILGDKQILQEAHAKILFMNRNLENLVEERTRELAFSERKYRRIFEVSKDMILVAGGDGAVLSLNPAGAEMLNLPPEKIENEKVFFQDFFHEPEDWDALQNTLHSQGYTMSMEVELKRRDGTRFSALLSASLEMHPDEKGETLHFLVKDISQRKAMQKQLLQADKLASVGQLAAGIAHEINNPLSLILGYTQLLLRNEESDTERFEDLKIIEKHARTCKNIVGDLLSFSRSARTNKDVSHLNQLVEEVLSVVRHHFEVDGVTIQAELDPLVPPMILDAEKIKQVFMNLVMNAKQSMGKNGSLRVATHFDEAHHMVFVNFTDTGTGIEPQYLSRIFDPFFTTKGTGEGTGLGLSVSYGIVKDHGGEILVESEVGKGSTFTVVLPVILESTNSK
jgi:PAS domain S-box-containing protein